MDLRYNCPRFTKLIVVQHEESGEVEQEQPRSLDGGSGQASEDAVCIHRVVIYRRCLTTPQPPDPKESKHIQNEQVPDAVRYILDNHTRSVLTVLS